MMTCDLLISPLRSDIKFRDLIFETMLKKKIGPLPGMAMPFPSFQMDWLCLEGLPCNIYPTTLSITLL